MTNEALEELLILLNKYACTRFKRAGLEIELSSHNIPSPIAAPLPAETSTGTIQEIPIAEEELPIDLRADELMKQDAILNWSSPDSQEDLPLTMGE